MSKIHQPHRRSGLALGPPAGRASSSRSCEPMCAWMPWRARPSSSPDPLDRGGEVGHGEAELRVGLPGGDLLVRLAANVGSDPYKHALPIFPFPFPGRPGRMRPGPARRMCRAARRRMHRLENIICESRVPRRPAGEPLPRQQPRQTVDLVEVVDRDQSDPRPERHLKLRHRLGVAVHNDPLRRKARVEREVELPTGGHVTPQPLLGKERQDGRTGKRLGGERDVKVVVAGVCPGPNEGTGPPAGRPRRRRRPACQTRGRARSCRTPPPRGGRAR